MARRPRAFDRSSVVPAPKAEPRQKVGSEREVKPPRIPGNRRGPARGGGPIAAGGAGTLRGVVGLRGILSGVGRRSGAVRPRVAALATVPTVLPAGRGRQPGCRDPVAGDTHYGHTAPGAARRGGRKGRGAGSRLHCRGGRDRGRAWGSGYKGPSDGGAYPGRSGCSGHFAAVLAPAAPAGRSLVPLIGKSSS